MITESTIYWVTRMDYFQKAGLVVGVILSIIAVFIFVQSICDYVEKERRKALTISIPALLASLCLFFGSLFIPNTKEMCAILIIPKIVNDKQVQELPQKFLELANEWLEELKPKKDKGD